MSKETKPLTAKEYLEQFPNAKPEKEIDWLGFAREYATQEVRRHLKALSEEIKIEVYSDSKLPHLTVNRVYQEYLTKNNLDQ